MDEYLEENRRQILEKFSNIAHEKKAMATVVKLDGDAREELCRYCQFINADVLVLGTRSRGALKSVVLGSVGMYCIQHAPCPVLIARPTATQGHVDEQKLTMPEAKVAA
eukprot:TRINITY_DN2019_c0_g1_i1.p1 TRINITY_DN2019_c0_g1~~TRINITY_DN2019_c0_g1_i1.p1  ORF type:complete len:109 (+),score=12.48 TRINITY_DN2019_c0_g1_i1:357-683(+)